MRREFIGMMGKLICEAEELNDLVIVRLSGQADVYTSPELSRILEAYLRRGEINILLDLEKLAYLDSSTLRVLFDLQKKSEAAGGTLKLLKLQGPPLKVFQMSGFLQLFQTFQDQEEAEESFRKE